MKEFSKNLRMLRLEKNMTQKQLGAILNVHYTTIRDWEIRNTEPSYTTLIKIAHFFEVSVDYLLDNDV